MSTGNFPESLGQAILLGIDLSREIGRTCFTELAERAEYGSCEMPAAILHLFWVRPERDLPFEWGEIPPTYRQRPRRFDPKDPSLWDWVNSILPYTFGRLGLQTLRPNPIRKKHKAAEFTTRLPHHNCKQTPPDREPPSWEVHPVRLLRVWVSVGLTQANS